MKKDLLLIVGLILLVLGVVLNRVIADFPAYMVALIHISAIVCFGIAIYKQRKEKANKK